MTDPKAAIAAHALACRLDSDGPSAVDAAIAGPTTQAEATARWEAAAGVTYDDNTRARVAAVARALEQDALDRADAAAARTVERREGPGARRPRPATKTRPATRPATRPDGRR